MQLLTTAVHNKPGLVVPHLPSTLPLLYQQTEVNKELIRWVTRRSQVVSDELQINFRWSLDGLWTVSVGLSRSQSVCGSSWVRWVWVRLWRGELLCSHCVFRVAVGERGSRGMQLVDSRSWLSRVWHGRHC